MTDTRTWKVTIDVTINADNFKDAETTTSRLLALVIDPPAVVSGKATFEPTYEPEWKTRP